MRSARTLAFVAVLAVGCHREPTAIRKPDDPDVAVRAPGAAVRASTVQVALGRYHACALASDGSVRCVGRNDYGQLGDGSVEDRSRAVRVRGLVDAVEVAVGDYHSCARRSDRTVSCWGYNATGQLGDGSRVDRGVPWPVVGLDMIDELALGAHHSCARNSEGAVWCWGYAGDGEVGDGATLDRPRPVRARLEAARRIVAGSYHTCAIVGDEVRCWGSNMAGQLGDGSMANRAEPVRVRGLRRVHDVALGFAHSCARGDEGTMRCWGANFQAQLGDGTRDAHTEATAVPGLRGVRTMALGFAHTCALTVEGRVRCWGDVRAPLDHELASVSAVAAAGATTCWSSTTGASRCDGWDFFERLLVP